MTNPTNTPANLILTADQRERLGKGPNDHQHLEPVDIELALSDPDMWTSLLRASRSCWRTA